MLSIDSIWNCVPIIAVYITEYQAIDKQCHYLVFYCILCYCVSCLVYVCYMCMAASAK